MRTNPAKTHGLDPQGPEIGFPSKKNPWKDIFEDPWKNIAAINPELENNPELLDLKEWYTSAVNLLPIMETVGAPLENDEWLTIHASEIDPITQHHPLIEIRKPDGSFFRIIGVKCTRTDRVTGKEVGKSWMQPVILNEEKELTLKIFNTETPLLVYGLLGYIQDTDGNVLMTVDQEITMDNPNNCIVRLPVQGSSNKLSEILAGNVEIDPGLFQLMKAYGCSTFQELLDKSQQILPIPPENNREIKHNIGVEFPLVESDSEMHKQLVKDGKRKWLTPNQLDMLVAAGITSSHTSAVIRTIESARKIRGL